MKKLLIAVMMGVAFTGNANAFEFNSNNDVIVQSVIAQIINKSLIKVKVWERGAGLTKACGTAACATAYAGRLNNLTDNETDIEFEKGKLTISIDEKYSIHMRGPVSDINEINIKL